MISGYKAEMLRDARKRGRLTWNKIKSALCKMKENQSFVQSKQKDAEKLYCFFCSFATEEEYLYNEHMNEKHSEYKILWSNTDN